MKLSDAIMNILIRKGVRQLYFDRSASLSTVSSSLLTAAEHRGIITIGLPGMAEAIAAAEGCALALGSPVALVGTSSGEPGVSAEPMLNAAAPVLLLRCPGARKELGIGKPLPSMFKWKSSPFDAASLSYELEKAIFLATRHGRKGPVQIDLQNIEMEQELDFTGLDPFEKSEDYWDLFTSEPPIRDGELDRLIGLLRHSRRPLILAGGGVRLAGAASELHELMELTGIPAMATIGGLETLPAGSTLNRGLASVSLRNKADLTLALGCSPAVCNRLQRGSLLLRVEKDSDSLEGEQQYLLHGFHSDVRLFLTALIARLQAVGFPRKAPTGLRNSTPPAPFPLRDGLLVVRRSLPGLETLLAVMPLASGQRLLPLTGEPGSEFAAVIGVMHAMPGARIALLIDRADLSAASPELLHQLFPAGLPNPLPLPGRRLLLPLGPP